MEKLCVVIKIKYRITEPVADVCLLDVGNKVCQWFDLECPTSELENPYIGRGAFVLYDTDKKAFRKIESEKIGHELAILIRSSMEESRKAIGCFQASLVSHEFDDLPYQGLIESAKITKLNHDKKIFNDVWVSINHTLTETSSWDIFNEKPKKDFDHQFLGVINSIKHLSNDKIEIRIVTTKGQINPLVMSVLDFNSNLEIGSVVQQAKITDPLIIIEPSYDNIGILISFQEELIRLRNFLLKSLVSFDKSESSLDNMKAHSVRTSKLFKAIAILEIENALPALEKQLEPFIPQTNKQI